MTILSFVKKIIKSTFISGIETAVKETIDEAEEKAEELIDHAEIKATEFMNNLFKGAILFFIGLIGGVFALVGIGMFISTKVSGLENGVGFILIGAIVFIFIAFARAIQKE